MKNKLIVFLLFIFGLSYGQAPLRINYQGVMRGSYGAPVLSQPIQLTFKIYQGGNTTTATYTEPQGSITTNSLGLILTQIGKNGNLGTLNWQNGPFFLEVLVDNGSGFVSMGLQEILSVPFSMHAKTVPATYTNNLLTVGGNTFTLPPAATITPLGILNMTNTATNSFVLDVPAPSFTSAGPVTITGTYPNLTLTSPTVPPNMTVTPSGIVNVTNTALNSVVVGVQSPTFTSVGPSSITGTYPNLTITSPTVAPTTTVTANAAGIATVSNPGLNNFIVGVPQPTFTAIGATSITGVYPNLTVNSPAATPATSVSANAAGIATVSSTGTNSFVIGVPHPTFTSVGPTTISGVYPNLTVTTPTIPPTTSISVSGAATINTLAVNRFTIGVPQSSITVSALPGTQSVSTAGTNSFNINVPQTNITVSNLPGTTSVSTIGTNSFNINVPPGVTPVTPSVAGAGAAVVVPASGNSFTVTVPQTNITSSGIGTITPVGTNTFDINIPQTNLSATGAATVTGSFPNYTVNAPAPSPQSTLTASGIITITPIGTNSFNINANQTNLSATGAATVTGSFPNYTVNAPAASPQSTLTTSGIGTVTSAGTNSFDINIAQTNLTVSQSAGVISMATVSANNFSLNIPPAITPVISTAGAITQTTSGSSFTLNVPVTNVAVTSTAGAVGVTSAGTNSFNINVPPAITPTLTGTGLASVTPVGNTFTVNVPLLTYTNTTGTLGSGTNTTNITQPISINGTTITSGASSNSISLASVTPWRQAAGSVTLATATDKVDIGGSAPTENLQVESVTSASVSILSGATQTSEIAFGTIGNHTLGRMRYNNNTNEFSLWTNSTADRIFINAAGNMGIGQNLPVSKLDVNGNLRLGGSKLFLGAVGGVNSGYAGVYENAGALTLAVFKSGAGATGFGPAGDSYDALFIKANTGEIGIGTIAPIENVQIEATTASLSLISGATNISDFLFGSTANHGLGRVRYDNSTNTMSFWTNANSRMSINNSGQVVIGTNVPVLANTALLLSRNGAFDNRLVITGGDNTNTYGGMINFAENLNHVGGMSLKLDAISKKLLITTDLAGTTPIMAIGGYSTTVAGVNIGSTFAAASPIANGLIVEGNVGIGTGTPLHKFEVAPGAAPIGTAQGQSTFFHNSGVGAALFAESNANGTQTGTTSLYARAILAGWQNSPQLSGDVGVQGFGATWGGAFSGGGSFATPNTYAGIGGGTYSGVFMGGNVGIGTAAPDALFNVEGEVDLGNSNTVTGAFSGAIGTNLTVAGDYAYALGNYGSAANQGSMILGDYFGGSPSVLASSAIDQFSARFDSGYRFFTDGALTSSQGIFFASNGYVGLGTAAPTTHFQINGTGNMGDIRMNDLLPFIFLNASSGTNNKGLAFEDGGVSSGYIYHDGSSIHIQEGSSGPQLFVTAGQVGIGTSAPAFDLQLTNNSAAKPLSSLWTVPSDLRLKKDVHPYVDGLAELMKIKPVWYTYTGEADMPQVTGVGVIAQELQEVAPYMVSEWTYKPSSKPGTNFDPSKDKLPAPTGEKKNYLAVDGSAMTYMMINAIKEQQKIIEDQKARLEELEARLKALENK